MPLESAVEGPPALVVGRAEVAERRVEAFAVVEDLDPLEDGEPDLTTSWEHRPVDELFFERPEKDSATALSQHWPTPESD
jgi:hypothetical protein